MSLHRNESRLIEVEWTKRNMKGLLAELYLVKERIKESE